jgi:hypothetical protein
LRPLIDARKPSGAGDVGLQKLERRRYQKQAGVIGAVELRALPDKRIGSTSFRLHDLSWA